MDKTPVCGTGTSGSTPGESTNTQAARVLLGFAPLVYTC